MVGRQTVELSNWKLVRWSIGVLSSWRHLFIDGEIGFATSKFWLFLIMVFSFAILYTLVMNLTDIFLDIGCFFGVWFDYFEFTLTLIWINTLVLTWLCLVLNVLVIDYRTFFNHALHCLWFLLEIVPLMNVLYYLLVLAFDIFYLLFQILELHV